MAETAQNQRNIANNIKSQFGQEALADREPSKAASRIILQFRSGTTYLALKADAKVDAEGKVVEERPRLVSSFNNHYVDLPLNGNWWKEFTDFAKDMATVLEGVAIENINTSSDVEAGKRLMSKYRNA